MASDEDEGVFFVKIYKKEDRSIGHAISPTRSFPESLSEASADAFTDAIETGADALFSAHLSSFVDSITVYTDFMPVVLALVPQLSGNMLKASVEAFLKSNSASKEEIEGGTIYELKTDFYSDFIQLAGNTKPSFDASTSLSRNVLMGLIALLDHHIRDVMRLSLLANPKLLESKETSFTLKEILTFKDIEALRSHSIQFEVDRMSREGRDKQVKWFEDSFKIEKISGNYESWSQLMEICERRNLFAHTNGRVSDQYLQNAEIHKYSVQGINSGQKLEVNQKYFRSAVECIFEFGVMLTHVVRKKLIKSSESEADSDLSQLGFRLLQRGQYSLASKILKFAWADRNIKTQEIKNTIAVNYANALRLKDKPEESKKILDSVDWSACRGDFEICVAALRDDVDDVVRLMKAGVGLRDTAYREWPVFFHVREETKFKDAYQDVFGLPYEAAPKQRDAVSEIMKYVNADSGQSQPITSEKNPAETTDISPVAEDESVEPPDSTFH
jgi:hypothetical protein